MKCTLILEVSYLYYVHITDFGLIAYQRILALIYTKRKLINKLSFDMIGLLYKELTPYEAMNLTFNYPMYVTVA